MPYERVHRPGYAVAARTGEEGDSAGTPAHVARIEITAPSEEKQVQWMRDYIYTRRGLQALLASQAQEERKAIHPAGSIIAVRQCEELADLRHEAFHYPKRLREALGTPQQRYFYGFDPDAQAEAFALPDDLYAGNQQIKDLWMRVVPTHGEQLLLQEAREQIAAKDYWKAGLAMREKAGISEQKGKQEEARSNLVQADLILRDALRTRAGEDSIEAEVERDTIVQQRAGVLWRAAEGFYQLPPRTEGEREDLAYVLTQMPGMPAPKGQFGIRVELRELDELILRAAHTLRTTAPIFSDLRRGVRQFARAWATQMELDEALEYYGAIINPPNPGPKIKKGLTVIASTLPDRYR